MRHLLGLGGLLFAQSFYVEVRSEALEKVFRRGHITAIARLGGIWRHLQEVRPLLSDSLHPLSRWFVVRLAQQDSQAALEALRNHPEVKWAEGASGRRLCTQSLLGWHHVALGTVAAWTRTQGSSRITVAIIDSGIEWSLPAFHRQLWVNLPEDLNHNGIPDSTDLNHMDDDGNGFVDDVIGFDFTEQPFLPWFGDNRYPDPFPRDENGHGTAVASLIGARNDLSPVAGLAPGTRLMILRCFSADGYGEDDDIARAIVYAADNGARVINCSFGDRIPSRMMHAAIQYAVSRGCVVIAASGNGTGGAPHFPSGFPEVIAVGGMAYDEASGKYYLWPLSGYYRVDWVAPADKVPVLLPDGSVKAFSGTSLAAALSSAAVALLLSRYPTLSPEGVRATFASRAAPIGREGWSSFTGSGRLSLLPALDLPQEATAGWISPPDQSTLRGTVAFVFSTYHSLLQRWEISYAQRLEGPWSPLKSGTAARLRDTLRGWTPPAGRGILRLLLRLKNGHETAYLLSFTYASQRLSLRHVSTARGWWAGVAGNIIDWEVSEPSIGCLATERGLFCADKVDSVGALWVPPGVQGQLSVYSFSDTVRTSLSFTSQRFQSLPYAPWQAQSVATPLGIYFPQRGADWDGDGEGDFILTGIRPEDGRLGRLYYLRRTSTWYEPYDSVATFPLLPRHLMDWDGDGRLELLCIWVDSFYILGGSPPKNLLWKGAGRAARLAVGRKVWLRSPEGNYELWTTEGQRILSLPDTVSWTGSTTIPRLLSVSTPTETLWAFGNYSGWIFLYRPDGSLLRAIHTRLNQVGSFLESLDLDGDGWEEILYLGQGVSGTWWEMGLLSVQTGQVLWRERFWGGIAGIGRLFVSGRKALIWLPPHLYIGELTSQGWKGEGFDARAWETFGMWEEGGSYRLLLGKDSVPRFFGYAPPMSAAVVWAQPGGISPTTARLRWHALSPAPPSYNLYRLSPTAPPLLRYSGPDTSFIETGLTPGETYAFVVESGGAVSEPFFLRPRERPCLHSATLDTTGLCIIRGEGLWIGEAPEAFWALSDSIRPLTAWASGETWVLSFPPRLSLDSIMVDTLLTDAYGMYLSGDCGRLLIRMQAPPSCSVPTEWRIENSHSLSIDFSAPLPAQAYEKENYQLLPLGSVEKVEATPYGIRLFVSLNLETQPVVVRWSWGEQHCPQQVALSPVRDGHSWGFFPNPLRPTDRELYLWGLSAGETIQVLTPAGYLCAIIHVSDSEGPTRWNLRTFSGEKLAPGVYLLRRGNSLQKLLVE
ncbi:MAG: S8 family serine peptidase [Bacteroidia bacterium]|nr:S8 family serine peptidase [Bacteroidia bacterium]